MATIPSVEDEQKKSQPDQIITQSQQQNPPETNNDLQENQTDEQDEKEENQLSPEFFNDDIDESNKMEKLSLDIQPYFSNNTLPKSLYLQQSILPIVYEALSQVEKLRPKDPIEFFAVYIMDRNKMEFNKAKREKAKEKEAIE